MGRIRRAATCASNIVKRRLMKCLRELKNMEFVYSADHEPSEGKAHNALCFIYEAGIFQMNFTEEEKRRIGNLLVDTIKPIQLNIERTYWCSRMRLETILLIKRSALQFLVENYAEFPARNSTLIKELEKVNIKESIKLLDDVVEEVHGVDPYKMAETVAEAVYDSDGWWTDYESAGGNIVPDTHTWWPR